MVSRVAPIRSTRLADDGFVPRSEQPVRPAAGAAWGGRAGSTGTVTLPPMRIGAHVRDEDPVGAAAERGAEVVQFFLSDPQGWKAPTPHPQTEALLAGDVQVAPPARPRRAAPRSA